MVDLEGKTLYEALGVAKDASQAEIRKAYLKLAVTLHPDKNGGDAKATERFQTLQKLYSILSDPEKRKVYDQTGSVEDSEELAGDKFNELYEYYRDMFAKVTEDDIDSFQQQYRGGEEERGDMLKYYQQFQGDMDKVFEWVMCSDPERDSHRFMDMIEAAMQAGEVKSTKKFVAWSKKVQRRPRPADPLAPAPKKDKKRGSDKQQGDEAALIAQIRNRQQSAAGNLFSRLAAKYGEGESEENEPYNEPTEEEFQAARQRLEARKGGSGGKGSSIKAGAGKAAKRAKK